jgi:multidrug efflux pump subunit AcrA (membrane-fusion protein)
MAEVRTDACPDKAYSASVLRIEPQADIAKNTITVRLSVADPDPLLFPEMTCTVSFLPDAEAGAGLPLAPQAGIRRDGDGSYVLVAESGRARRAPIEPGEAIGPWLAVRTGVASGARIILGEDPRLADGAAVTEAE